METPQARQPGPRGLGARPRLHGHERVLRSADEAESIATIHRALDLGVDFLDTADMYGPFTNEELVGTRHRAAAATEVRARHQVRQRARRRRRLRSASTAARLRAPAPATPRCSGSASTSSTSTTSTASTRRRRSRRPSAPWPSWCAPARCATSACPRRRRRRSAAPTPCTRSPRCRPSTRCGAATSRTRSLPTVRELGIGFVAYSPLGRGFLTGRYRTPDDLARRRLPPHASRASRARTSPTTSSSWSRSRRWRARRARPRPARAGVGAGPGRGRRADLRHQAARVPRREPRRARRRALAPTTCARLDEIVPKGAAAGDALPRAGHAERQPLTGTQRGPVRCGRGETRGRNFAGAYVPRTISCGVTLPQQY